MGTPRVGWYRLVDGQPFHGTVPDGAAELTSDEVASLAAEQPVDAGENEPTVGAEVPGLDLTPETEQVDTGPAVTAATDDNVEGDPEIVGHEKAR